MKKHAFVIVILLIIFFLSPSIAESKACGSFVTTYQKNLPKGYDKEQKARYRVIYNGKDKVYLIYDANKIETLPDCTIRFFPPVYSQEYNDWPDSRKWERRNIPDSFDTYFVLNQNVSIIDNKNIKKYKGAVNEDPHPEGTLQDRKKYAENITKYWTEMKGQPLYLSVQGKGGKTLLYESATMSHSMASNFSRDNNFLWWSMGFKKVIFNNTLHGKSWSHNVKMD